MVCFEVVRASRVQAEVCATRIPLAPVDTSFYNENTYLPWQMFFDYDLDAERLLHAFKKLAKKRPCLCGRLRPDAQSRYAIEVHASSEESHGFPFIEAKAEVSVAEAVLKHGKMKEASAKFPCFPKLPFFVEPLDLQAAISGKGPLVKAKLTHLTDGCVLSVSVSHIVVDGQRAMEIFRDISRAYCEQEVPEWDHDRSRMWPDRLAEYYPFLGEEVASLPRKCVPRRLTVGFPEFYSQPIESEILYFSKEVLEDLKKQVGPFLAEGEYVSSNDVLLALVWMLHAEMDAQKPVESVDDLNVETIRAVVVMECLKANFALLPSNYCGVATVGPILRAEAKDLKGKSFSETLAFLARLSRNTVNAVRETPSLQAEYLLNYYRELNCTEFRKSNDKPPFTLSNLVKTPAREIDFGKGKPVLAHTTLLMPLHGIIEFASPGPRDDGSILYYGLFLKKELETLKKSVVIKMCAGGMKRLYSDFSVAGMNAFLRMK